MSFLPGYLFTAGFLVIAVSTFDEFYENDEYFYMSDDSSTLQSVNGYDPIDKALILKVNKENTNMYYLYTSCGIEPERLNNNFTFEKNKGKETTSSFAKSDPNNVYFDSLGFVQFSDILLISGNIPNIEIKKSPLIPETLIYDNERSLNESHFNASKITVFIIHGWFGNQYSTVNTLLTEAFLQDGDVNVIIVDWREAAEFNYWTAKAAVPYVGRHIAKFIWWLTSYGLTFDKVHLIGHSLGAHVAGNAGRETESKVQRITGLDPAGPFWDKSPDRLVKADAQYVEVIHTNTKCFGYKDITGDADFFPNGGHFMPHCYTNVCSHSQSYYYMAETIKYNNLYGLPCSSIDDVLSNTCTGDPYLMGTSDLTKNRSGVFRVDTSYFTPKMTETFTLRRELQKTENRRFMSFLGLGCFW